MGSTRLTQAWRVVLVVLVVLVALTLRLYRLGGQSLWIDEAWQVHVASQPIPDILRNYRPTAAPATTDQAPLSLLIGHFFVAPRDGEFRARLPSAVFGTVSVLLLFLLARRLVAFTPALLAAGALALSPVHVWYSQEARWYALWVCLAILSYLALLRSERRSSAGPWIAFGLVTLASLYTFVYTLFVIAAQGVSLLWRVRLKLVERAVIWRFTLVIVLVFVAALPVVWMVAGHAGNPYSGTTRGSSLLELPYSFLVYSAGFTVGPTVASLHGSRLPMRILRDHSEIIPIVIVFIVISGVGLRAIARDHGLVAWVVPWLVVPPLLTFLVAWVITNMTYQVRYTLAALPAFSLLVGVGVFSLRPFRRNLACAAVLVVSLYSLSNLYWSDRYHKADVRGAVRHIRLEEAAEHRPEAQVMVVGQVELAMLYYGIQPGLKVVSCGVDRLTSLPHIDLDGTSAGTSEEAPALDMSGPMWVLSGRDWKGCTSRCLDLVAPSHEVAEHVTLPGLEMWRLDARSEHAVTSGK